MGTVEKPLVGRGRETRWASQRLAPTDATLNGNAPLPQKAKPPEKIPERLEKFEKLLKAP
jgi:hypothetical protein